MSWQDVVKYRSSNETPAEYYASNAAYRKMWAEDAADRLPEMAAWPEKFDETFKEFRSLASQYLSTDERAERGFMSKLNEIKKLALEEWEKYVSQSVRLIEEAGSERDKAKLKANRHWMRGGTIRSQEELYPPKKKE